MEYEDHSCAERSESVKGRWERDEEGSQVIKGRDCEIILTQRPYYCDRGNFLAYLVHRFPITEDVIDGSDGWPRYYFDETRAKQECEAWLIKRKRWIG